MYRYIVIHNVSMYVSILQIEYQCIDILIDVHNDIIVYRSIKCYLYCIKDMLLKTI